MLVADVAQIAQTTVRSRDARTGRYVRTIHIEQARIDGGWTGDEGDTHSHRRCPRIEGEPRPADIGDGWACESCIHTHDHAEVALGRARYEAELEQDRIGHYGPTGGARIEQPAPAPIPEPKPEPAPRRTRRAPRSARIGGHRIPHPLSAR